MIDLRQEIEDRWDVENDKRWRSCDHCFGLSDIEQVIDFTQQKIDEAVRQERYRVREWAQTYFVAKGGPYTRALIATTKRDLLTLLTPPQDTQLADNK